MVTTKLADTPPSGLPTGGLVNSRTCQLTADDAGNRK